MKHNYEYPVHPILFLRDDKYLTRAPSHPSLLKHVSDKKGLLQISAIVEIQSSIYSHF